jgi:hypothetical protein
MAKAMVRKQATALVMAMGWVMATPAASGLDSSVPE